MEGPTMTMKVEPIESLVKLAATEVKKQGWRGIMRTVEPEGIVAVTNHNEPEAVIVSAKEWTKIVAIMAQVESETSAVLETLRKRFDERLAVLKEPDAGDRLRAVMATPARLDGTLKAGSGY